MRDRQSVENFYFKSGLTLTNKSAKHFFYVLLSKKKKEKKEKKKEINFFHLRSTVRTVSIKSKTKHYLLYLPCLTALRVVF